MEVDFKKIINDNLIDSFLDNDLNDDMFDEIIKTYLEIMSDINTEYEEKTKTLVIKNDNFKNDSFNTK